MKQDRECSMCGWILFGNDFHYEQRKERHEEYHTRTGASKNHSIGKVTWLAKW